MTSDCMPDDYCDTCGEQSDTGWIVYTGETDTELHAPIVKFVCDACHAKSLNR